MSMLLPAFIAVLLLVIYQVQQQRKKNKIKRWANSLNLPQHSQVFNELFCNTDGFALSKLAREKQDAFAYTYGEIEFLSFIALIGLTHPDENTRFYDLGSGVGKAAIACALVFDLKQSCGIELFEPLHQEALTQKKRLARVPGYESKAERIQFIHNDFLQEDLGPATLLFINATTFIGDLWKQLSEKLGEVAGGATVITISKKLSSNAFKVIRTTQVNMSWGIVTAYIQEHQYQAEDY